MGSYTYGEMDVNFSVPLTDEELEQYTEKILSRCAQCRANEPDWYDFDPEGWSIGPGQGDDCGYVDVSSAGFVVDVGGKVYDLQMAVEHFVHVLPLHIQVEGQGFFDTDGEHWGLMAKRREVQGKNVELVMEPWKEEALQTAAYAALELMEGGNL